MTGIFKEHISIRIAFDRATDNVINILVAIVVQIGERDSMPFL